MATVTALIDDINGAPEASSYNFIVGDREYVIDLAEENAKELQSLQDQFAEKMAHFIRAGRSVGKANPRRPATNKPSYDAATVRIWANENGFTVSDRGRIPLEVLEAYENRDKK